MLAKCIYDERLFDPSQGEGDHPLSARLFGEFEGDKHFRGVCPACNNTLGRLEQVLAQSSQYGHLRRLANPNLGRRGRRGGLVQRGAHGSPGPVFKMDYDNTPWLARPCTENPNDYTAPDQVLIIDSSGNEHHIEVFPNMPVERFRAEMARRQISTVKEVFLQCEWPVFDHLKRVLADVFPGWHSVNEHRVDPGTYPTSGTAQFEFKHEYHRALAKIAFHYYLVHNRRSLTGAEPQFQPIREFIQNGGDPTPFFQHPAREFWVPFRRDADGKVVCPTEWCHLLAADEVFDTAVVFLHLYVGPGCVLEPTYVTLGTTNSRLVLPGGAWGHIYMVERDRTDRYAGKVTAALIERRQ